MRYEHRGAVPQKRHVAVREEGRLLTEEVMGYEGFSGNESILYHLHSPAAVRDVGEFRRFTRAEWLPDAHAHRLLQTQSLREPQGDPVSGRRLVMWNDDVEISICRPALQMDYYFRDGEGDEVLFIHHGGGELETQFGTLTYRERDYVVIPRGTIYRVRPRGEQLWLTFFTPGEIETPSRYRNRYGQLLEGAPFSQRDFRAPETLETHRELGDFELRVRVRDGIQVYHTEHHPLDVVGWDGYVYPYAFNVDDFEPITGRIHQPPPVHQSFQGPNFVICSFCPRHLDYDDNAVPIPYHHSNLQSEEMLYYVAGNFGSRRGVDVGSMTLHPSGLPHGPQPGLAEGAIGAAATSELAVMCDTFRPLRYTTLAQQVDDPRYALSWYVPADRMEDALAWTADGH